MDDNACELVNYCTDIDDYRPVQSTLLTRFALTADCSDLWRTTNQDYGAFYYRDTSQFCMPDNLKANIHRRHNRFQDWMLYQTRYRNVLSPVTAHFSANNNNNQTVRITHRKRFSSKCENDEGRSALLSCSEDGLVSSLFF